MPREGKIEQKEQNKNAAPWIGQQKLTICDTACYDECAPKRGQKEALLHRRRLATSLRREVMLGWETFSGSFLYAWPLRPTYSP